MDWLDEMNKPERFEKPFLWPYEKGERWFMKGKPDKTGKDLYTNADPTEQGKIDLLEFYREAIGRSYGPQ